jgi:hypothetical protein
VLILNFSPFSSETLLEFFGGCTDGISWPNKVITGKFLGLRWALVLVHNG